MAKRIDHSGHPHPSTPAARALCRANGGTGRITKSDSTSKSDKKPRQAPEPPVAKVGPSKATKAAPSKAASVEDPKASKPKVAEVTKPTIRVKGNTDYSLKRKDANTQAVILDGEEVGTILKSVEVEYKDISGTMLRSAKGKKVTRYYVQLNQSKFKEDRRYLFARGMGHRSLSSAKLDLVERLRLLTQVS